MKKRIIQLLYIFLGVIAFHLLGCQSNQGPKPVQFPSHPITQGVSAPFAGFIGNWMVVGGGCNFPTIPAAEGGKKVYYSDIVGCNVANDSLEWTLQSDFAFPIAYGASVEIEEGLICLGGMNEQASLREVFCIGIDSLKRQLSIHSLPSLPEAIDNAAATRIGRQLYITGGNQENGGNALYTMCLDTDTVWTKLADYPGAKRIQPVLLASEEELFLFGGFQSDQANKQAIISTDFIVYNIKNNSWENPKAIPSMRNEGQRALVGSAGTRVGNKLLIAGGVNYQIFKNAVEGKAPTDYMKRPAEWYQFSKDLLIYNLETKDWSVISGLKGFNKAGGSLLHHDGALYMICGEVKPGIRTNEIVRKDLTSILSE